MTSLPSQHPAISMHLTDASLTPLISSSRSQSHLESLTSLTNTALASQTACQRVRLGAPERIMVEYPDRGPVVLQSFLDPAAAHPHHLQNQGSSPDTAGDEHGVGVGVGGGDPRRPDSGASGTPGAPAGRSRPVSSEGDLKAEDAAPVLLSVVVAGSADQAREARKAAAQLERVAREFQREWANDTI